MKTIKQVSLFFKSGNSDKEYHIQLVEQNGKFIVNFQYGRVGNALQSGTKTPIPVSEEDATKIFDKLESEKRKKGYDTRDGEKKNNFSESLSSIKSKEVIILPQLLNSIEEEDVEKYINDNEWLAQEKFDGNRRMIISNGKITGTNKKGQSVPLPNLIIDSIKGIDCTIDGEIIGERLYAFDLLSSHNGKDLKSIPCIERIALLNILGIISKDGIVVIKTAYNTKEKNAMYERLKRENAEGIVFKKKDSFYTAGRPASGGNQLKYKFTKTCSCIVANITKGKRSIGLEMIDGDKKINMGKCTISSNFDIPAIGSIVEIRYLYCFPNGGKLFQPVYLKDRTNECDLSDCNTNQIIYKAE